MRRAPGSARRGVPADVAPAVIDTIHAHGLYAWMYRGAEWYVTDPRAPHAAREETTVQFHPTCVTTSNEDEGFARAVEEFILPRAVAAPMRPPAV